MAVNYNLQFLCEVPVTERFQETGESRLSLKCRQKGPQGPAGVYLGRPCLGRAGREPCGLPGSGLALPLITQRLDALDIMELELRHAEGQDSWTISCESLIGSATWVLLPPVFSMITPKNSECIQFLELFELRRTRW